MPAAGSSAPRPPGHSTSGFNGWSHPLPRHVWVTLTGTTTDRHPGVLLDWRRDRVGAWQALVAWGFGGGRETAHLRVDWLAAHHVAPR